MSDDQTRVELDDWRDLVQSPGWGRLKDAFEHQWGDSAVMTVLEKTTAAGVTEHVAEEASRLLQVRVAMRGFLAHPVRRISELERQHAKEKTVTAPWTRTT